MNIQTNIQTDSDHRSPPMQEALADFVTNLDADQIPTTVRVRALHHMLDATGIAMASTRYDFAHKTLAGLRGLAGHGDVPSSQRA